MEMDSLCGHVLHHLTVLTVFSLLANLNSSYPLMLIPLAMYHCEQLVFPLGGLLIDKDDKVD